MSVSTDNAESACLGSGKKKSGNKYSLQGQSNASNLAKTRALHGARAVTFAPQRTALQNTTKSPSADADPIENPLCFVNAPAGQTTSMKAPKATDAGALMQTHMNDVLKRVADDKGNINVDLATSLLSLMAIANAAVVQLIPLSCDVLSFGVKIELKGKDILPFG